MHDNKLIQLLKKLPVNEVKAFHSYLKKEFKPESIAIRLFDFLRKYYPDFNPSKITYEKAHKFLYPNKPFKKRLVANSLSDIRIVLRKYLVEQYLEEETLEKDLLLLQVYSKYQLDHHFEQQVNQIKKRIERKGEKDMWFFLHQMKLNDAHYSYINTQREKARQNIYDAMENLDRFYTAAKLKYSCELFNGYQVMNEPKPDIRYLEEIASSQLNNNSVYNRFYAMALSVIRTRDNLTFEKLKKEFQENYGALEKKDQFIILSYLLNHVSYIVRKDQQKHSWEEYFELMKFGYDNQVFIVDGTLIPEHFLNTMEMAGVLKKVDWAKEIIVKWGEWLEPADKEYYLTLSNAILNFHLQNFEACSNALLQIDVKEPQNKIRGRWLSIIAAYELNAEISHLLDRCTAFEKFVRRNKFIHQKRKEAIFLSIKIMRMLLKISPDKQKILDLLKNGENFHYKSWMIQKVKALKERHHE